MFYFDMFKFYNHIHTTFCEDLYDFLRFEIQARDYEHYTTNDKHYKKSVTRTRKSSQTFLATKPIVTNENNYPDVAMKS